LRRKERKQNEGPKNRLATEGVDLLLGGVPWLELVAFHCKQEAFSWHTWGKNSLSSSAMVLISMFSFDRFISL
jgi:hypothetical protein